MFYNKLDYRFNEIPIKILEGYFSDFNKLILKFVWGGKRLRITEMILKQKNKIEGLTLLNFKTYFNSTVSNTVLYWQKSRQIHGTELRAQK